MTEILSTEEFRIWVSKISNKYKKAQIKAAISVNSEMLKFYFDLGKEIANNSFKSKYGSKFYDTLSKELIFNLPNVKGLSVINLRYMEKFYNLYYHEIQIVPQLVEELFSIPWGIIDILSINAKMLIKQCILSERFMKIIGRETYY